VTTGQKFRVALPDWWEAYTGVCRTVAPWQIPLWEKEEDALDDFYASGRAGLLEIGTTFVVMAASGDMTKIRTDTGTEGWIKSHVLSECPPA